MKKAVMFSVFLIIAVSLLFSASVYAVECNDGIDNDGDGTIDGLQNGFITKAGVWIPVRLFNSAGQQITTCVEQCNLNGLVLSTNSWGQQCADERSSTNESIGELGVGMFGIYPYEGCTPFGCRDVRQPSFTATYIGDDNGQGTPVGPYCFYSGQTSERHYPVKACYCTYQNSKDLQ